jgi:asparagine synthase (glutamine-hydrolysing)
MLRDELKELGREFKTTSDTEVLLHALDQWGVEVISRLNGMWGFFYVDEDNHQVIVSRDRCGMKPLYYYWDEKTLAVASEVKGLLKSGAVKAELDTDSLVEYFTFQNVISDRTLFKNVSMVPAGVNMIFDLRKKTLKSERYWDFNFQNNSVKSESALLEELDDVFDKSIARHMIGDVEIGATISGGLDSSAIVSFVSQNQKKLKTFTGFFDVSGNDAADRSVSERDDARMVARHYNTDHYELEIKPHDFTETLSNIVYHLEDPKVGMCYTFYRICQLVSSKLKVSLSGSGGDEIFAGYPWRYQRVHDLKNPEQFNAELFNCWNRVIPVAAQASAFTPQLKKSTAYFNPYDEFKTIIDRAGDGTPIDKALYFEAKTFLHGMLLVEDKLGMASSIETRFPLLDFELIEFAMMIPDHLKYKDGRGKYILRKMLAKRLPVEILDKKKQGFTPPDNTWYRKQLWQYLNELLLSPRSRILEYFDRAYVEGIFKSHQSGNDERFPLWSLAFFEMWCRTFLC